MTLKINARYGALYLIYAALVVFTNFALDGVPFSLGLCFSALACGTNIILTPLIYVLASITYLNWKSTLLRLAEGVFSALVVFIYRKSKRKMRIEAAAYLVIALAPYIAFGEQSLIFEGGLQNGYIVRAIAAAAVIIFCYFCFKSVYCMLFKIMRSKLKEDEIVCCAVVFAAFGTGFYNLCGFFAYFLLALCAVIFAARLCRSPSVFAVSLVCAIPPALVELSLQPFAPYLAIGVAALLFCGAGRFAPSLICAALSAAYMYFCHQFDCSPVLIVLRIFLIIVATLLPSLFSWEYLKKLKGKLLVEEVLPDCAVERSKRRMGEKLYKISQVFREIECAFLSLDDGVDDNKLKKRMVDELKEKCCKTCDRAKICAKSEVYSGFRQLVNTGCVKGKVSLVDLPSQITINCSNATDILTKLNLLLSDYRRFMTEAENARLGRVLLSEQAHGVAEVMKNCAVELSNSSRESKEVEKAIKSALSSYGISCPELYIDDGNEELLAVINGNINIKALTQVISETAGKKYVLKEKLSYDNEKSCLVFCSPPPLDAAFGVAYAIKSGESVSGDTHSVIKINEHSFLMALSDGMGSGEYAKKVSSTAISLIEAFYKAEMPEGTVLNTINKLLSFNRDERFTCIDIAAINLNSGTANFVKIGSPVGIILREGEIKVLESNSLPLGILENLHPTVCTQQLKAGDMVLFMSDGITSCFPSSTELYAYLQTLHPLNPQNVADTILAEAKKRGDGISDDMTVLCTRIF